MIDLFQLHCGGNRKINKLDNAWQLNRVVLLPLRPHPSRITPSHRTLHDDVLIADR